MNIHVTPWIPPGHTSGAVRFSLSGAVPTSPCLRGNGRCSSTTWTRVAPCNPCACERKEPLWGCTCAPRDPCSLFLGAHMFTWNPHLHPVPFAKEDFVVVSWGSAGSGGTSAPMLKVLVFALGRAEVTPDLKFTDFLSGSHFRDHLSFVHLNRLLTDCIFASHRCSRTY